MHSHYNLGTYATTVLKISWLLFGLKYILCPKVENFDKFQKSLKSCSFINNDDNELKLVCLSLSGGSTSLLNFIKIRDGPGKK